MLHEFHHLFITEIKDLYNAEQQLIQALPAIERAVRHPELKRAFQDHLKETERQLERLEEIGEALNIDFSRADCPAMKGLIQESEKHLHLTASSEVKDAALIGSVQRIEHYEIAAYGTLKAYAKHLKLPKIEALLAETLREEGHFDQRLTKIAEGTLFFSGINDHASKRRSA